MAVIHVSMGDLKVASRGDILVTFVGSCVACCIYNSNKAAMAHIMLPYSKGNNESKKGKYADLAIDTMLRLLDDNNLKAKIAGGAKIFTHEQDEDFFNIGLRNATAIKDILRSRGIRIEGEDLGNTHSRNIRFDTTTLKMIIRNRDGVIIL